jgi:hypothetical protein
MLSLRIIMRDGGSRVSPIYHEVSSATSSYFVIFYSDFFTLISGSMGNGLRHSPLRHRGIPQALLALRVRVCSFKERSEAMDGRPRYRVHVSVTVWTVVYILAHSRPFSYNHESRGLGSISTVKLSCDS